MPRKLLFLCSRNKLRSPTAEAVFSEYPGIETDSAGLSDDADVPLEPDQIEWADLILVMENHHRKRLNEKFGRILSGKRVVVLGIPDNYQYMDPALVKKLKETCRAHLS